MHRKTLCLTAIALLLCTCFVLSSMGGDKHKFRRVAELTATGGPKEVALDQEAKWCMIRVMKGTVIINTIVVREGAKKTPITVAKRLNKGDKHVVDLGPKRRITGLRISDDAGGTYRVYLKR